MNIRQRLTSHMEEMVAKGAEQVEAIVQSGAQAGYLVGLPPDEEGLGVSINLADYDRYSVTLRYLELYNSSQPVANKTVNAYLQAWAEQIIQRLTYLEEPLALLELEASEGWAQLRSNPPDHTPTESTYWEVWLSLKPHPQVRLARYHWSSRQPERQPVLYPVTFATLGRLAEDLATSLTEVASELAAKPAD